MTEPRLVASVLNADLARLGEVCAELEAAGCDGIQWDVMDGHYVPNLTVGHSVIAACRRATNLPFEAHLMIESPELSMHEYVEAGCDMVIVHQETCPHLHRTLDAIRRMGAQAGVAINPSTPVQSIQHVIDLCDLVLIMTVNPGFGGQSYISTMEPKIAEARELIRRSRRVISLEVDGGIAPGTIAGAARAGADRFVVGSAMYKGRGASEQVPALRAALEDDSEVTV